MELWKTWHDVGCNKAIKKLFTKENSLYNKQRNKLLTEHEKKKADIEAEAAKLGVALRFYVAIFCSVLLRYTQSLQAGILIRSSRMFKPISSSIAKSYS